MTDWYPNAQRVLGPASKRRPGTNPVRGVVMHSLEGSEAGIRPELYNASRVANWHATVLQDGTILQHHPFSVRLNHAGDAWCNDNTVGIEHEGITPAGSSTGPTLTEAQRTASVALVRWLAEQYGFKPARTGAAKTMWEHTEVSDTGTQCPSARIPWSAYLVAAVPDAKPPKAPTAFYRPDKVAAFWTQAYANGAKPIRYDPDGKAIYEVRVNP